VNVHTNGAAIAKPLARLVAPPIVAVYTVPGASVVPAVNVKVAIVFVASRLTAPVGLTHGAAQVSVKVAAPVIGETGSFKVADMEVVVRSTLAAPFTGVSAITAGISPAVPGLPKI
jgi:hypothetical protein